MTIHVARRKLKVKVMGQANAVGPTLTERSISRQCFFSKLIVTIFKLYCDNNEQLWTSLALAVFKMCPFTLFVSCPFQPYLSHKSIIWNNVT